MHFAVAEPDEHLERCYARSDELVPAAFKLNVVTPRTFRIVFHD